jgi:hypothetical protein
MEDLKEFEECKQACSNLIMNILQESEVLTWNIQTRKM